MKKKILVIHGFNSSPQSLKAQITKQYIRQYFPNVEVICPQLLSNPNAAIKQLSNIIEEDLQCQWYLTGSSLGGYFATYLSDKYNFKAVLINPAVKPYELLEDILGEQTNPYTNEVYRVTVEHMQHLKKFEIDKINAKNFLVMVQTGDEVLDYQQAVDKYQQSQLCVQQDGDHSFINFSKMLPDIVNFFQLNKPNS
ncbi:YqiA/YcfP family alpha/beta fold hydrolase [Thalassotalea psychrophila]|uniref:YqiA/YcfP family alpha/beta fold hydrolase n=1 Tax=Thalassotalea psychrophila TaxID=3065647 RepID=A0ABY9TSA1_9GAMM|nr:YqiA/YcfP family alpha/beta fold hydrolase [Colwelliaceae bacterium SQ149]